MSRHLEAHNLPTVIIGSARDIVEQCGVARFVFTDFPLGNPCGKPNDVVMQKAILDMGLTLLKSAVYPRSTVQAPFIWSQEDDTAWRKSYMEITS